MRRRMQGVVFGCLQGPGPARQDGLSRACLTLVTSSSLSALAASSSLASSSILQTSQPNKTLQYSSTLNSPHCSNSEPRIPRQSPKMSGAAQGSANTTKAVTTDSKDTSQPLQPQKPGAQLEEDDEFEDFPVEGAYCPIITSSLDANTLRYRLDQGRGSRITGRCHAPVGGELG